MKSLFFMELKNRTTEIMADKNNETGIGKVLDAVKLITQIFNIVRNEGLLAMEERGEKLGINVTDVFLSDCIMLVVDGTEPELYREIGFAKYYTAGLFGYDALICLIYLKGLELIQAGENPRVFEEYIKAMLPANIREILEKTQNNNVVQTQVSEKDKIKMLCMDGTMVENDYSILGQTATTLIKLTDREMQRLLREVDNTSLAIAMKGLPGQARKKIFSNVSERLCTLIIEDMEYMGPVRMCDVDDCCAKMMTVLLKMESSGEIADRNFEALKVVLDIYNSGKQANELQRERYRELKKILDSIYNDN